MNDTGENLQALFIEDSEADLEPIVQELGREGFGVEWERVEGEQGLRQKLRERRPDIIISNYSMPAFSGIEALRIVRELEPDTPFIVISGAIGEEHAIETIRHGATDFILKSNLHRLGAAVRRAVSESRERAGNQVSEEDRLRLAAILETTSDYVAIYTPDLHYAYLNAAGRRLLGLGENEEIGDLHLADLHPVWSFDIIRKQALEAVKQNGLWEGEGALLSRDRREIPVSKVMVGHKDARGDLAYISVIGRDIRDRKAFERQISYLANFDGLTDLPNRTLLRDRVLQAITHSRRNDRAIGLLVADVDRFKLVNDGFGHETGDVLLRQIGERLRRIVRDGDTIARLGADTFAILAVDLNRPDDILSVVRKIQAGMSKPFVLKGQETHITLSIGASIYRRDGEDFESMLRNAEAAMHRAKIGGRDGFEYYTAEMTHNAVDRVDLDNALRQALQSNNLEMHYQPQVQLDSGKVVGVEALMRWQRKGKGWIPPAQFIPVAEESDLILSLGDFALSTACRQMCSWGDSLGEDPLRMSVNVSARQFRSRGFVDTVERALHTTGITPQRLELEITESILIEDKEQVAATIGRLKQLGVRISVDDFGTGYSSLSYLSRLPIDCLKIDQSFVHSMGEDNYNVHIIQAIISMAHSLGMTVIAEGIETQKQLEFLRAHGCNEGQGFLFAKPMSADRLTKDTLALVVRNHQSS